MEPVQQLLTGTAPGHDPAVPATHALRLSVPGPRLPDPGRRALPITRTLPATSVTEQFQNVLTHLVFQ